MARHLARRDIRTEQTCIEGIREVPSGTRLTVSAGKILAEQLWSPWYFTSSSQAILDRNEAAERIYVTANHCIGASVSKSRHSLLMLSGGLDSSIVAACLQRQRRPFTALNLVTRDPSGDEREHARLVSRAFGNRLLERVRDVSRVDIAQSAAARLPRPTLRSFLQESRRLAGEAAKEVGADVILNGGGGDNIFCFLQSAAPAADRLKTSGPGPAFWRTTMEISRMAPASLWTVAKGAFRLAWRSSLSGADAGDMSLLSRRAIEVAASPSLPHPWLQAPAAALPGKAAHVRLLAYAQSYVEGLDPQDEPFTVPPLLSQPLVETCLRVPSWEWFAHGNNRAAARRAFSADLPEQIARRRSKGSPDSFVAEIFEGNRAKLRDLLAGGFIGESGIIDVPAVLSVLDDPRPVKGGLFRRVLEFADVEAWARAWSERR